MNVHNITTIAWLELSANDKLIFNSRHQNQYFGYHAVACVKTKVKLFLMKLQHFFLISSPV